MNRPNPDSKKPQPTRVRGHTLSKGGASVAVHLMIKHITFVLTILTFMAILMISYHVDIGRYLTFDIALYHLMITF